MFWFLFFVKHTPLYTLWTSPSPFWSKEVLRGWVVGKSASCVVLVEWHFHRDLMGGKIVGVEPCPRFLYFVTHYVGNMPIASRGGILCDVLFNPKYAGCVYNAMVAINSFINIVCPLSPGESTDVLMRDLKKGLKDPMDILWIMGWIMRWASWILHTSRPPNSSTVYWSKFMASTGHTSNTCFHACGIGAS